MDDNPKLEAAMQHLEVCTDMLIDAHKKKFNVVARAASSAQTCWYVIIEAIRESRPTGQIDDGWRWAERAEAAMEVCSRHMENAVSFKTERGREYAMRDANNALQKAADAAYYLGKAATSVHNPRASQYVSAARMVARGQSVDLGLRSQRAVTQIEHEEQGGKRRDVGKKGDELFKYHTAVDSEGMDTGSNN